MVTLAGRTLGKYRLIEQLGRGGFASVYKAYHARLDRYVAVKVLHPHLVEGEDFLARFEREARAVAALRHPNIVIVHDFDVEDNIYYMVMEYIQGQSLKDVLLQYNARKTFLPLKDVQRIMAGVTRALDYAHEQGMLHRDVKPSNVILNTAGEAFLTDFGIARILSSTQFTATGALIGTPAYMSPEQGQGLAVSSASDVYSLGVMLYEFLTGHVPFDADTPLAIIFKHILDPLPSILTFRPELPQDLEKVVYKALAKDPQDRFQKPGEMMAALSTALQQASQAETVLRPRQPTSVEPEAAPIGGEDLPPGQGELPATLVSSEPISDHAKAATVALEKSMERPDEEGERVEEEIPPEEGEPAVDLAEASILAGETPLDSKVEIQPQLHEEEIRETSDQDRTEVPEDETELDAGTVLPALEAAEARPTSLQETEKRQWYRSRWFQLGGILIVILALVGILLFNVFRPGEVDQRARQAVVATATTRPARPSPTTVPEPTENPGLAAFEEGLIQLHEARNYDQAIELFNQAEESGFTDPSLYANRAFACSENQFHFGECDYQTAMRDFERAIELDPDQAQVYMFRATYYDHIGNLEAAIEDWTRALHLEPDNPEPWANRGVAYGVIGEFDAAMADINHALELQPDYAPFYQARAGIHREAGNQEAAVEDLSRAIELAPENLDFWVERGWRFLDMDVLDEAIADFNQAIDRAPGEPPAYVGRAQAYARQGNYDAAMQDLNTAIDLQPRNDWLYFERAHVFWWHIQDFEAAIKDLRVATSLNPGNWEAFMNLGEIFVYEMNDLDQGFENFNRAVEIAPREIEVPLINRGIAYNYVEAWERAIKDFTLAIRISPENPEGYVSRGHAYRELGLLDEARADFHMFLELSAGMPEYEDRRQEIETWLANNP